MGGFAGGFPAISAAGGDRWRSRVSTQQFDLTGNLCVWPLAADGMSERAGDADNYWAGINAATTALLLGAKDKARKLARNIQDGRFGVMDIKYSQALVPRTRGIILAILVPGKRSTDSNNCDPR